MPPTGLTRDAGWQIGARKTFDLPLEEAWKLLTSRDGLRAWLGDLPDFEPAKGAEYHLEDGTRGRITVFKPESHLRMTWHPPGYPRASILQVRVIPNGEKTAIAFHQEHLPNARARGERKAFFGRAIQELQDLVQNG